MRSIKKVALGVFKDGQILLVRSSKKDQVFYTLGGKIKEGESDLECLKREVWEEVSCRIDESSLKFLYQFQGPAHGSKEKLDIKIYSGKLIGEPKVSSEVIELGYFDSNSPEKNLSEIAQKIIFPWLRENGYIN